MPVVCNTCEGRIYRRYRICPVIDEARKQTVIYRCRNCNCCSIHLWSYYILSNGEKADCTYVMEPMTRWDAVKLFKRLTNKDDPWFTENFRPEQGAVGEFLAAR